MDKFNVLEQALAAAAGSVSPNDIEDIFKRLKELETDMNNKLDCDIFDNEIAALRAMIGNMD